MLVISSNKREHEHLYKAHYEKQEADNDRHGAQENDILGELPIVLGQATAQVDERGSIAAKRVRLLATTRCDVYAAAIWNIGNIWKFAVKLIAILVDVRDLVVRVVVVEASRRVATKRDYSLPVLVAVNAYMSK